MEKAIKVENVTVRYGDRTILENINFEVNHGEILVIVGGSGCGKSTILRQIIGLERPAEGRVLISGNDISNANDIEKKKILSKFGVLFQSSGLFASMTIGENIALVLEKYTNLSPERIEQVIDMKLGTVGLDGFQDFYPAEISGGMKKRAALARAMALDPDILFFDEPSSGLDPVTAASLDKLIIELNSGLKTTMVIVTHDLSSILSIADRVVMLDKSVKGIIASGTTEELRNWQDNEKVYNFFNRIADK